MSLVGRANTLDKVWKMQFVLKRHQAECRKVCFTMFDHSEPHHYSKLATLHAHTRWELRGIGQVQVRSRLAYYRPEMRGVVKSLHHLLQVYVLVHEPDAQDV